MQKRWHHAKDCPDKYKASSLRSKVCLKCGDSVHDMFSCRNNYQQDDLKEICCYVCKCVGHLCCIKYMDSCPKEVCCYRCGQVGHTGLSCTRLNGETTNIKSLSSCYKCGGEGHFARECKSSSEMGKRNRESSTPTLRSHREQKHNKAVKSAPHDLGQARKKKKTSSMIHPPLCFDLSQALKKKKTKHERSGVRAPKKSKHRGGWIVDDPGDFSLDNGRKNGWKSPKIPSSKGHKIPLLTRDGHISTSQSKRSRQDVGTPNSHGPSRGFQHGHYKTPYFQEPSHGFQDSHYATPNFQGPSHGFRHGPYATSNFHGPFHGFRHNNHKERFGNSSSGGNRRNYNWW